MSRWSRGRVIAVAVIAAWAAIAVGTFETFYLSIFMRDRQAMGAQLTELPYRRIPGQRRLLVEVQRRTPSGARILIVLPHRPWQGGYGYGFRRAQYLLEGRTAVPLLDRATDRVDPKSGASAEYVACWPRCGVPQGYVLVFQSDDGMLLRRVR